MPHLKPDRQTTIAILMDKTSTYGETALIQAENFLLLFGLSIKFLQNFVFL